GDVAAQLLRDAHRLRGLLAERVEVLDAKTQIRFVVLMPHRIRGRDRRRSHVRSNKCAEDLRRRRSAALCGAATSERLLTELPLWLRRLLPRDVGREVIRVLRRGDEAVNRRPSDQRDRAGGNEDERRAPPRQLREDD